MKKKIPICQARSSSLRELGFSRDELTHALGVSFITINRCKNGKTVPSKLGQAFFENFCAKMTKQGGS